MRLSEEERRRWWVQVRWMMPARRYPLLIARAMILPRSRQRLFQWRLRRAGRRVPAGDLVFMLEAGWREALVATWLIAAGRRADLRPVIERGLLGEQPSGHGWGYCSALACLATEEDARILVAYLDQALLVPPGEPGLDRHCQPQAIAALSYLDKQLGTDHAERFLAEGGLWQRWPGSADYSLVEQQEYLRYEVVLATGGDPGVRRHLKLERQNESG